MQAAEHTVEEPAGQPSEHAAERIVAQPAVKTVLYPSAEISGLRHRRTRPDAQNDDIIFGKRPRVSASSSGLGLCR